MIEYSIMEGCALSDESVCRSNPEASAAPEQGSRVRISRLRLAAWLQLNGQQVEARELLDDGRVVYYFQDVPEVKRLRDTFSPKNNPELSRLFRFAELFSAEIRTAVNLRRRAGFYDERERHTREIEDVATEMIGDRESALHWMRTPSHYLGGKAPFDIIDTPEGRDLIIESLNSIAYGGVS